jgi:hypothetical protein
LAGKFMAKKKISFWIWFAAAVFAVANLIFFYLKVITGPDTLQVQYIPDDAFYYLGLARNFTHLLTWTFDSGISQASGFHLLYAYILSGLYAVFHPSNQGFVFVALILGASTTLVAAIYGLWIGIKLKNVFFLLSLTCILSSETFIKNSISCVEWPFVILFAALFCGTLYNGFSHSHTPQTLLLLGFLGSLARSDFFILPGAFLASGILVCYFNKDKTAIRSLVWGMAGAILGIAFLLIHNYFFFGSLLQSSALIKLYWAKFTPLNSYSILVLAASLTGFIPFHGLQQTLYKISVLPVLIIVAIQIIRRRKQFLSLRSTHIFPTRESIFVLAGIIAFLGYIVFYTRNGAVQYWYMSNFTLPVFILLVGSGKFLATKLFNKPEVSLIFLLIPGALLYILTLQSVYPLGAQKSVWPHQQSTLAAGKYLHDHPLDGRVGAWNAGVIGYYQGGEVVNIDGLVNNDIYPFILSNSLAAYLDSKQITYLVDSQSMVDDGKLRQRGGYDDPAFLLRLKAIKTFDSGIGSWKSLTLYRIQNGSEESLSK